MKTRPLGKTGIDLPIGNVGMLRGNYAQVVWHVLRVPASLEAGELSVEVEVDGAARKLEWNGKSENAREFKAAFAADDVVAQEFQCLVKFQ